MTKGFERFNKQFKQAAKKAEKKTEQVIRGAAIELFSEIVSRTPVGNPVLWASEPPAGYVGGRLRGNWQTSLSHPITSELNIEDKVGANTISKGAAGISKYTLDQTIWFTNNLPYAQRVEDGWSTQRPEGMVKTSIKAFQPALNKISATIRNR